MINEPKPYTTILPKCGHSYFYNLSEAALKLSFDVEMKSIQEDIRAANVFYLTPDYYDFQLEQILDLGLVFFPLSRVENYTGFTHKQTPVANLDKNSMSFGVVAKDLKTAKEFKEYYIKTDHTGMGKILGYPDCCIQAFNQYTKKYPDPVYEIARNTPHTIENGVIVLEDISYQLQIHHRYFGFKIIPWFPCSYICDASLEACEVWLDLMRKIDSETTEKIISVLTMPSTWSLFNSQVVVNKPPHKKSVYVGYSTSYYDPIKQDVEFRSLV